MMREKGFSMDHGYSAGTYQIHQDGTAAVSADGGALQKLRAGQCPCRERSKDKCSKGVQKQGGNLAVALQQARAFGACSDQSSSRQ